MKKRLLLLAMLAHTLGSTVSAQQNAYVAATENAYVKARGADMGEVKWLSLIHISEPTRRS